MRPRYARGSGIVPAQIAAGHCPHTERAGVPDWSGFSQVLLNRRLVAVSELQRLNTGDGETLARAAEADSRGPAEVSIVIPAPVP